VRSDSSGVVWRGSADDPGSQRAPYFLPAGASAGAGTLQRVAATAPDVQGAQAQGVLQYWRSLTDALPSMIQATLWGLAVMLPVALIYWALGRHQSDNPSPEQVQRARNGVLALLYFMAALALQPILLAVSRTVLTQAELWPFVIDYARADGQFVFTFAPIAFVVVLLIVPLLRAGEAPPRRTGGWLTRGMLAVFSLVLVVLAVAAAHGERVLISGLPLEGLQEAFPRIFRNIDMTKRDVVGGSLLILLLLAWCLIGLLTFWMPVYWLARSVLRHGALFGAAFGAAALTFFLPMLTPAAEALRLIIASSTATYGGLGPGSGLLSAFATVTSVAGVVIMVALVLRGFREIAIAMLAPDAAPRLRSWLRSGILLVLAIFIVAPTTDAVANPEAANSRVYQFMTTFHAYGGLLALLAPLAALRVIDASRREAGRSVRFRIDHTMLLLLTTAFAGYLSLWVREPFGAPILIAVAWVVFSYGIIGEEVAVDDGDGAGLAQRILTYRTATRLLDARLATFEKKFTDGEIDAQALTGQREVIAAETAGARDALGMSADEAKRRLLGLGPGASPMQNAVVGAIAGLLVAALLQVVLPIDFRPRSSEHAPAWLHFLQAFIVDPNYRPVGTTPDVSHLLSVISELLNATAIWVLLGFLFGFAFHRIRGSDGFAKAIVFSAGIAVTFLASQALIAGSAGVPLTALSRLVPIFLFMIFLGSLVFDGSSVQRQGVPYGKLPDIYGLRTSVGYASFAGIIAGVQPVLQLFDWLLSRGG
jgi:hypothetical protein